MEKQVTQLKPLQAGLWSCFDFNALWREIQAVERGDDLQERSDHHSVTAIVCAYNEEKTVSGVLEALVSSTLVDEIIIVDDGSQDNTAAILGQFAGRPGIQTICLPLNRGKGWAMAHATSLAHGEILLFVDADLMNWGEGYVHQMVKPLMAARADMVIGYPLRQKDHLDGFDPFGLMRWISGERAVWRADFLPLVDLLRESRLGVETLINLSYLQDHKRIEIFSLDGLIHPIKFEKEALPAALRNYWLELGEISRALFSHPGLALRAAGINPTAVQVSFEQLIRVSIFEMTTLDRNARPYMRSLALSNIRLLKQALERWEARLQSLAIVEK